METDARQKEITRDLDDYIASKRKGGGIFGLFNKGEQTTVSTHPHVKPYDEAPPQEQVSVVVTPEESQGDMNEPVEQKKGWFSRLFNGEEGEQPAQESVEVAAPVEDEDLKEIARISLSFLKMADPAALAQIKSSPDFDKFKEILRRRNIIK